MFLSWSSPIVCSCYILLVISCISATAEVKDPQYKEWKQGQILNKVLGGNYA